MKRLIPLFVVLGIIAIFYSLDGPQYFTFQTLKQHRESLIGFVQSYPFGAPLLFMLLYALVIALSIPGGAMLSITAGFLFGQWLGTGMVVIAATCGATLLFLLARYVLGDLLQTKAAPWFKKMEKGFQKNAFSYLLTLRLIPLFPFFVVNLVPAFLGVRLKTYVFATLIGIIPGTFVFIAAGVGLGSILEAGKEFTAQGILTPHIIFALVGLACLSILPVLYKKIKGA